MKPKDNAGMPLLLMFGQAQTSAAFEYRYDKRRMLNIALTNGFKTPVVQVEPKLALLKTMTRQPGED